MYRIIVPLVGALLTGGVASGRPFTNSDGKTIEAEISSATATTVTLKLATGKKARIKLDTLSAADQEFVKSWVANRVPRLRVDPKLIRSNRDDEQGDFFFDDGAQTQMLSMSVEVQNEDTRAALTDSELRFYLIGRSVRNRNEYKILAVQSAALKLAAQESSLIQFKPVKNNYDDGDYGKSGHKCMGYVLYAKRNSDGREVYSFASTPTLEKGVFNIANLKSGDVTDENFIKTVRRGRDGGGDSGIIEVK